MAKLTENTVKMQCVFILVFFLGYIFRMKLTRGKILVRPRVRERAGIVYDPLNESDLYECLGRADECRVKANVGDFLIVAANSVVQIADNRYIVPDECVLAILDFPNEIEKMIEENEIDA